MRDVWKTPERLPREDDPDRTINKLIATLNNIEVTEAESDAQEHANAGRSEETPQGASRISTSEEWEVRYWTHELGDSADELKALVSKHGNSASKVRQALGKGHG